MRRPGVSVAALKIRLVSSVRRINHNKNFASAVKRDCALSLHIGLELSRICDATARRVLPKV